MPFVPRNHDSVRPIYLVVEYGSAAQLERHPDETMDFGVLHKKHPNFQDSGWKFPQSWPSKSHLSSC